jgi:protein TonB
MNVKLFFQFKSCEKFFLWKFFHHGILEETTFMEANQILQANILEIIFDGRNKAYGAYDLRKTYNKRITTALITMISLMLLLIISSIIGRHFKKEQTFVPVYIPETKIQKIKPEEIKVLPTPKMPEQHVATIKSTPPVIVKDPLVVDPPPDIKQLEGAKIDLKTMEGTKDIGIVAPPSEITGTKVVATPVSKKTDEDAPFIRVEIEAKFPGGAEAWQRYIQKAIISQLGEFSDADYGTCVLQFIVDKNGNVSDVKATTMAGTKLAEIATNAIRKGPKWTPAMQNGRYVNAYRIQPVTLNKPDE